MNRRLDIAIHPTQGCPKLGLDPRGGCVARGDVIGMQAHRFTLGAVRRDGNPAT